MHRVKTFPNEISEEFKKFNVKYVPDFSISSDGTDNVVKSKWLEKEGASMYDDLVDYHILESPYFSVSFRMQCG